MKCFQIIACASFPNLWHNQKKKKKKVTEGGICNPSITNWLTLLAWARDKIIYNIPLTDKIPLGTHIFSQLAEKEISFDSSQATPKCCPLWLVWAQPALACTAGHLVTSQSTRCLMALVPQRSNCIHSLALEKVNRPFPVCNEELNYQLLLCVCQGCSHAAQLLLCFHLPVSVSFGNRARRLKFFHTQFFFFNYS